MSPVRLLIVLIAAVSAIGLAVVLQRALGGAPAKPTGLVEGAGAPAAQGKPMTQVLVAKRDLPVGTRLVAADVGWQAWPSDSINTAFITNGAAPAAPDGKVDAAKAAVADQMIGGDPAKVVEGAIVRDPILVGEPITPRKIVRGGEGGYLSVVLTPGKRAMSVPVTSDTAVGGFILPGDGVDVLSTRDAPAAGDAGGKVTVAETVLQNIRVLALDQATAAEKDAKSIVAATATLEVGPVEAETLARAKADGPITLALRGYTDMGGPSGVTRPVAGDDSTVRINRGGQTTSVAVRP